MRSRWPFALLIVVSVLGPLAGFAIVAERSRAAHLAEAETEARNAAMVLREQAERVFDTHELVMDAVERTVRDLDWTTISRFEAVHQELRRWSWGHRAIRVGSAALPSSRVRPPVLILQNFIVVGDRSSHQ